MNHKRHPSLEQVSVSAARTPGKLGHGRRLGFMPGKVIPHLAQSKPADLLRPKLHHRFVSSVTTQAAFYCRKFLTSGPRGRHEKQVSPAFF